MPSLAVTLPCSEARSGAASPVSVEGHNLSSGVWSVAESARAYRVGGWGAPYFSINEKGNIAVGPDGNSSCSWKDIDLMDVVDRAVREGTSTPFIVRFPEILRHRLATLHNAFERSIAQTGYDGHFQGVYPIKCNPDRYVVDDIVTYGSQYKFGLEVGSKPELFIGMTSMCHGSSEGLLICNGYKDVEYIRLALTARQIGLQVIVVLEKEDELDTVIEVSREMGVEPVIGLRAKLCTRHDGHWGETSGENGKFGLTVSEILNVVTKLRRNDMLSCLQMLHFHIGSQIPSLVLVDEGVSEAAHIYCELDILGANMKNIDIGGGLGVDYDGTHSASSEMSVGYSLEEYADRVVVAIKDACSLKNVKCPTITCESGRGLVSHHSAIIFDVLSARVNGQNFVDDRGLSLDFEGWPEELSRHREKFNYHLRGGEYKSALVCASVLKMESVRLFKSGRLSLERRATVEKMFDLVTNLSLQKKQGYGDKDVTDQTATYYINLSVFRSFPDTWGIGQLFPIVPIHRHDEAPTVDVTLSDITCDSDGKITTFINHDEATGGSKFLLAHKLVPKKAYYLGGFLTGAYQEIMGNMHNLFGTTDVVEVWQTGNGFEVKRVIPGQKVEDTVRAMHHEPHLMMGAVKMRLEELLRQNRLKSQFEVDLIQEFVGSCLRKSTYLV